MYLIISNLEETGEINEIMLSITWLQVTNDLSQYYLSKYFSFFKFYKILVKRHNDEKILVVFSEFIFITSVWRNEIWQYNLTGKKCFNVGH